MRTKAIATAVLVAGVALLTSGCEKLASAVQSERATVIPAPALDVPAASAASEVAVVAGGCFWGVQGVYQHVKGVTKAVSGYAGGERKNADYDLVGTGRTGHAESVEITFNPREISYGRLLQIFFSVAHNPTELNRQGPDGGPQYRSTIFPQNNAQAEIAKAYIAQLNRARVFDRTIATTIEMSRPFYAAEGYHQDYLYLNPSSPYIAMFDLPKLGELRKMFPDVYRTTPVLTSSHP